MEKKDYFVLNNGVHIPSLGFGTWELPEEEAETVIAWAVKAGYRHIDTAASYRNEKGVGRAVRNSGLKREELFVTSKLWNKHRGYEKTKKAFDSSLKALGLEYLDLYLIHWPAVEKQFSNWEEINAETWRAMEELYEEGKIRAIGLSNFLPKHIDALLKTAKIMPMVDQIEFHPGFAQIECLEYCKAHQIVTEAWSPLGRGDVLKNESLAKLSEKYHKSPAQLCIRWVMQYGALPLPKSVHENRIMENIDVFDFTISPEDMAIIDKIPYCGGLGLNPETVRF